MKSLSFVDESKQPSNLRSAHALENKVVGSNTARDRWAFFFNSAMQMETLSLGL